MRKIYIPLLCLFLFLLLSCRTTSSEHTTLPPAPHPPPSLSPSPPLDGQGIYEYCAPRLGQVCLDHLKQIHAGGFTLVLNYAQFQGNQVQLLTYAQEAQQDHLHIIWAFDDQSFLDAAAWQHFPQLAHECHCQTDQSFLPFLVSLVSHLPATWGYYVGDEVPPQEHEQVMRLSSIIHAFDPLHPRLFVTNTLKNLTLYTDVADVLVLDDYPIGNPTQSVADIGMLAQHAQTIADASHVSSGMVLQAHSLAEYPDAYDCKDTQGAVSLSVCPYPTISDIHQMKNAVLAHSHPRLILWYSFFDIQKSDNPAVRWENLLLGAFS